MDVTAKLRFLRMAPRKVRLVAETIQGVDAMKAVALLSFDAHHSAKPLRKLVESGLANAKHNFHLDPSSLYVKEIRVDGGPTLKRHFPRAMGRAAPIRRRTSHVILVLGEKVARGEKSQKSKIKNQNYRAPTS
ncbi:MAG: 50S ribosomal protein L22 [Patescibacteria group bacterium]